MRKNRIVFTLLGLILFLCVAFPQKAEAASCPSFNFTTINGGTVTNTTGSGKTRLYIFFRTTCGNSVQTVSNLANAVWLDNSNLKIYAADIDGASTADVKAFAKSYGNSGADITFCTGQNSTTMWAMLRAAGFYGNSVALPVCIVVDGNGAIQNYTTGCKDATDLWDSVAAYANFPTANVSLTGTNDYPEAFEVLKLVNKQREANGLAPLKMDQSLLSVAMQRAAECCAYYSHTRPNGQSCFTTPGFTGSFLGENIAIGYYNAADVMNGWMNSDGHRRNILNQSFTSMGVGVFFQDSTICWVQVFSSKTPTVAAASKEKIHTATVEVQDNPDYYTLYGQRNLKVGVSSELVLYLENLGFTAGGARLDPACLTFTSSNSRVAKVNAAGVVTPLKAGNVTFTVALRNGTTVKKLSATVATELKITKQPTTVSGTSGSVVKTTVTAVGDGLKYQWYFCEPGETRFSKSSLTGKTYYTNMAVAKSGRRVYCVITDKYGNKVQTNTVTLRAKVSVTKQPTNASAATGTQAKTTVTAVGVGLKYQWYFCEPGKTSFNKSSLSGKTYYTNMTAAKSGRRVYCVITDKYGNTVKTNTVTLSVKPKITKQPANVSVAVGKKASTSFTASGEGLKYQWYFRDPGMKSFSKSSLTGKTYQATITAAKSGRKVYCVITDKYGNTVKTNTVTLSVKPKITKQPTNVSVAVGKKASTSFTASGEGLKYQWYFCEPGKARFSKSSLTGKTYYTNMTAAKSGRRVYCVITDAYGVSIRTNIVTLKAK